MGEVGMAAQKSSQTRVVGILANKVHVHFTSLLLFIHSYFFPQCYPICLYQDYIIEREGLLLFVLITTIFFCVTLAGVAEVMKTTGQYLSITAHVGAI